jgi:O-antigen/teichoic acid export membrane protein
MTMGNAQVACDERMRITADSEGTGSRGPTPEAARQRLGPLGSYRTAVAQIGRWFFPITRFLTGQALVQLTNVLTGLVILRLLPIKQYALYTVANVLVSIGSVGSDMNLSQGLLTFGARVKDDHRELGAWFAAARRHRRILYFVLVGVILLLAPLMTRGHGWSAAEVTLCVLLALTATWVQQTVVLRNAIFYIHSDANGLLESGLANALGRLVFVVLVCAELPQASTALTANLVGLVLASYFVTARSRRYMSDVLPPAAQHLAALREFAIPLVPGVIYYMVQGQISTLLLTVFGQTTAIAEVGALGRLGQILGLLMMLNGFVILPNLARVNQRNEFILHGARLIVLFVVVGGMTLLSTFVAPEWWLYLLGGNYDHAREFLPLAMSGSLMSLLAALFHTMLISRAATRGQAWNIVVGIGIQGVVLATSGVRTTADALLLNFLLASGAAVLQLGLLVRALQKWK